MKHKPYFLIIPMLILGTSLQANDIWEETRGVNDEMNAKMMRFLAQQRALEANMSAEQREAMKKNDGGCGTVDIGNVQGGQSDDVETVVIIKGDVINANNKCR